MMLDGYGGSNSVGNREGRVVWLGRWLAVDAPAAFGLWSVSGRRQEEEPVDGPPHSPPRPPAPYSKGQDGADLCHGRMVVVVAVGGDTEARCSVISQCGHQVAPAS